MLTCQQCSYQSPKWLGRCPDCGEWNTFIEEEPRANDAVLTSCEPPQPISNVSSAQKLRYVTGISELDRVLGGGIVPGALMLLGGEPGIGKSTLLLQVCEQVAASFKVLLVSGEESRSQIKIRADRVGAKSTNIFLLAATNILAIENQIDELNPNLVIVDSIQVMTNPNSSSAAGSVSQVRECTQSLARVAKSKDIPIFIVGHVTKEGSIAGPRVLEHMVDTVLYFEGERHLPYRVIRAVKNRYGSTNEIGVFSMGDSGLSEVTNPSNLFLSQKTDVSPGSVVVATMEGTRPILVEVQVLVTPSHLATPRRLVSGLDYNRVMLTLAVLEKRAGLKLYDKDIFVSVTGGIRIVEPAADLAVVMSVASVYKNVRVSSDSVVFGEVGLSGEIRLANRAEERVKEAVKLGFNQAIMPEQSLEGSFPKIKFLKVKTIKESIESLK